MTGPVDVLTAKGWPRLRRITSSGDYIPEIDGLRFVAILSVVLYHLYGFLPTSGAGLRLQTAVSHGYRGVNLFYVISGFVLGMPFASHYLDNAPPVNLKAYFIRRLTRLEPPYLLSLLLCFALLVVQGAHPPALLPHLGASALYLHNLLYGEQSSINPVAWTLEVEVQFYCLMPAFALLFAIPSKTARRTVLAASILIVGAMQVACWNAPARAKMSILFAVQFFLAGLLLADFYVADWRGKATPSWRWDLVSCACWPVVFLMPDRAGWIAFPYLVLLLYIGAFRGVFFRSLFRNVWITTVGGMCYTIYLLHYRLIPLILQDSKLANNSAAVAAATCYLFALSIASVLYFVLIERPCMDRAWPRRLVKKLPRLSTFRSPEP